jgi:hypothetical protein
MVFLLFSWSGAACFPHHPVIKKETHSDSLTARNYRKPPQSQNKWRQVCIRRTKKQKLERRGLLFSSFVDFRLSAKIKTLLHKHVRQAQKHSHFFLFCRKQGTVHHCCHQCIVLAPWRVSRNASGDQEVVYQQVFSASRSCFWGGHSGTHKQPSQTQRAQLATILLTLKRGGLEVEFTVGRTKMSTQPLYARRLRSSV